MRHSLPATSPIASRRGEPRSAYRSWRSELSAPQGLLLVDFELPRDWLDGKGAQSLTAMYCLSAAGLRVAVTDRTLRADGCAPEEQFERWTRQFELAVYDEGQPLVCLPHAVPKPWGQEIWYTGVERRGVCCFGRDRGTTPIPWLRAALPEDAAGDPRAPLVLLKVLDPSPLPVVGDLYFELHLEKREVYVVTHVDETVWPGGTGYIRLGFDPRLIASHADERAFRRAYLAAVRAYEAQRRALDGLAAEGRQPSRAQHARERELRAAMNRFTRLQPLRVGDVVQVPLLVPHSLQHGVRTVEFQTPVYERKILSFAQRVQTQGHWDTAEAVALMELLPPPTPVFSQLEAGPGVCIERIVDFEDFEVRRITVDKGARWDFDPLADYGLLMVVRGELELGGNHFGAEQALLLPRGWKGGLGPSPGASAVVLLWALPRR